MGDSKLLGTIPDSLGRISSLIFLKIYNTKVGGTIPSSLSTITNLQVIQFQNTLLSKLI